MCRVKGEGWRVEGEGFRVQGVWCMVQDVEPRAQLVPQSRWQTIKNLTIVVNLTIVINYC